MGAGGVCVPTLRPCPYKTKQEMQTALAASGCNNMAGDCSAKCAHSYMPLTRECKTLIQQSNLKASREFVSRPWGPTPATERQVGSALTARTTTATA